MIALSRPCPTEMQFVSIYITHLFPTASSVFLTFHYNPQYIRLSDFTSVLHKTCTKYSKNFYMVHLELQVTNMQFFTVSQIRILRQTYDPPFPLND